MGFGMITESGLQMLSDLDVRGSLGQGLKGSNGNLEGSLGRDWNVYRSGSAPPTVEGSMNAVGNLFGNSNFQVPAINNSNGVLSEEEIRSHPAYLSYYYSHDNLNPRLPPPSLSKEDWRMAQRFQGGNVQMVSGFGGIGDRRKKEVYDDGSSQSLFSVQPGVSTRDGEANLVQPRQLTRPPSAEWIERDTDGLIGLAGVGLGSRRKSLADMLQEGLERPTSRSGHLSRPVSRNSFDDIVDPLGASDEQLTQLRNGIKSIGSCLSPGATTPGLVRVKSLGSSLSHSYASAVGASLSRSATPETPLIGRSVGSCLPPLGGRVSAVDRKNVASSNLPNGLVSAISDGADIADTLYGLNLLNDRLMEDVSRVQSQPGQDFRGYIPNGFTSNHGMSSVTTNQFDAGSANLNGSRNQMESNVHGPAVDPFYVPYSQRTSDYTPTLTLSDPSLGRNHIGTLHTDLPGLQKAYISALMEQQKQQYFMHFLDKSGGLNNGYYGNPPYMPYQGSPMANSVFPSVGLGSPNGYNEQISGFNSMRSSTGGSMGSWVSGNHRNPEESYTSSLLEEFKNSKIKCFELSDIAEHVVEFSVDQYGSRFIQQKLETATVKEKNVIFPEIIPHAHILMTDVFGNYVIQKFLEHGTDSQIKELASQLTGHVLPLSLQMYGCRVIQKALEVVDVAQQTQMVTELDGSIMKCVRDQNGNHVIQKCIECVPEDRIQFIISTFYGQVEALSTHPYGCRVIQRVLEHCDDPTTQRIIMEEIMQSVCTLGQDQYGNYVIQHVLQHGKPHERSAIINKLAGDIVKMSQQKFASNVVEKCLTFGGPEERQLLVKEMLGTTDENEPLQVMMKDPYGNYVVQKVLETCDNQSRELILSRIKVHLSALKKYTYGKHIVARVEKLITAGERRMGISPSHLS